MSDVSEVSIEDLQQQINELEKIVERRDKALKLEKNRDFRDVILTEFCVNECARYAQSSADPALKPENRADALAIAQAAGHLRRYLSVVVQMGNKAENEIAQIKQEIENIRREEA